MLAAGQSSKASPSTVGTTLAAIAFRAGTLPAVARREALVVGGVEAAEEVGVLHVGLGSGRAAIPERKTKLQKGKTAALSAATI